MRDIMLIIIGTPFFFPGSKICMLIPKLIFIMGFLIKGIQKSGLQS